LLSFCCNYLYHLLILMDEQKGYLFFKILLSP